MADIPTSSRLYICIKCRTPLATHEAVVSKAFQGRHGRAYLLSEIQNATYGPVQDRMLMTGMHSVADVFCKVCSSTVGWKYEKAHEETQKYKEGKYILEKAKVTKENGWTVD